VDADGRSVVKVLLKGVEVVDEVRLFGNANRWGDLSAEAEKLRFFMIHLELSLGS